MHYLISILLLPLTGYSVTSVVNNKIIGGEEATLKEFPFMIEIQWNLGRDWYLACGGTLISEQVIITTGQCMLGFNPENLRVLANSTIREEGYIRNVSEIILHENYTENENGVPYFDVALIVVDIPFILSEQTMPCQLSIVEPEDGIFVSTAGWGATDVNLPFLSDFLKKAEMQLFNREECNEIYNNNLHYSNVTAQSICLVTFDGKQGPCSGDAGGPVVYNNSLVGIVSYSWQCADPDFPVVAVNIAYFYNWISEKL